MLGALVLAAVAGGPPAACLPADSLRSLYERGRPYQAFRGDVRARRALWLRNTSRGFDDADLLARARAAISRAGIWRLLVVADDSCGDSANTIPYLAALADSLGGALELRVVSSREAGARAVQDTHRTYDGRAATPTVLVLDADWREVGCWIERPGLLAAWAWEHEGRRSAGEYRARLLAWYDADRGRETIRDVLALIERAGAGRPCLGNT